MKSCMCRVSLTLTVLTLLGPARPCLADTMLAFRTPAGAVSIPRGQSKDLGTVDVHAFEQIRLVADERTGSAGNVIIRLTIMEGTEAVAILDTLALSPNSQVTRVYDVPGTKLLVSAEAVGRGSGSVAVDALIYGHSP